MTYRSNRIVLTTILAIVLVVPAMAAEPFAGTWKLNMAKSDFKGQRQTIEALGDNKYKFVSGNVTRVIKADGADQPTPYGTTESLTFKDANTWARTVKSNGVKVVTDVSTLSPDGNTVTVQGTNFHPDGTTSDIHLVVKRVGGKGGFAGEWELQDVKDTVPTQFRLSPFGKDGVTLYMESDKATTNITMDGKDCAAEGPSVPKGATTSGKRVGAEMHFTDKLNGKVMATYEFSLAANGKTLTITGHTPGNPKPTVQVYERQ